MRHALGRAAMIILSLLFLSTATIERAYGQKLYVFCEADDRAFDVGLGIKAAAVSLKKTLKDRVDLASLVVYNDPGSTWLGPDLHTSDEVARDILVAVEKCPATPEDTIFFYWSSHGNMDEYGHYCVVPTSRPTEKAQSFFRRSALVDALQSKGARLVVLFTESCNEPLEAELAFPVRPEFKGLAAPGNPPLVESLFFEPEGFVDFNSSRPGQKSGAGESSGGYCTQYLIDFIRENVNSEIEGWSKIFEELNKRLEEAPKGDALGVESSDGAVKSALSVSNQQVFCWSEPSEDGKKWTTRSDRWSSATGRPKLGDRVVAANEYKVDDSAELEKYLNSVGENSRDHPLVFTVVDGENGSTYYLMTNLASAPKETFLEYIDDRGVIVKSFEAGAFGARFRMFN